MPNIELARRGWSEGGVILILNSARLQSNTSMISTLARVQTTARNIPVPETVHQSRVETEIEVDTGIKTRTELRTGTVTTVPHRDVPLDQLHRRTC